MCSAQREINSTCYSCKNDKNNYSISGTHIVKNNIKQLICPTIKHCVCQKCKQIGHTTNHCSYKYIQPKDIQKYNETQIQINKVFSEIKKLILLEQIEKEEREQTNHTPTHTHFKIHCPICVKRNPNIQYTHLVQDKYGLIFCPYIKYNKCHSCHQKGHNDKHCLIEEDLNPIYDIKFNVQTNNTRRQNGNPERKSQN